MPEATKYKEILHSRTARYQPHKDQAVAMNLGEELCLGSKTEEAESRFREDRAESEDTAAYGGTGNSSFRDVLYSHFMMLVMYSLRFGPIAGSHILAESSTLNLNLKLIDHIAGRNLCAMDNWTQSDTSLARNPKKLPEKGGIHGDQDEEAIT